MKKEIIDLFTHEYDARKMSVDECNVWLLPSQELIVGLHFSNPVKNYLLMSEGDFCAFRSDELRRIHETKRSPFTDILVLLYREEDNEYTKIINGMASKVLDIIDSMQ